MSPRAVVVASLLITALLVYSVQAQSTTVSIADIQVVPGGSGTVPLYIYDVTDPDGVGTVQFDLKYDPFVVQITSTDDSDTDFTFTASSYDNVKGTFTVGGTYLGTVGTGPTGDVLIINVTFAAVGSAGDESALNLTGVILKDATAQQNDIPHEVDDGQFIILDLNSPPTVEIRSPENGTWYDSEEVSVTFYPQDDEDATVDYTIYVDGEEKANGTAVVDQNETVNLGIQAEGDRVIRVEVRDEAGKTGSAEVTIHVDLTEPTVEIRSPENGTWYDSEEVVVTFYPEDNKADVVDYTVYVDGEEKANGTAEVDQNKTVNLGIQAEGDRVIRVEVRNEAGKTGSAEVTIHVDLTEPTVEIRSPENGTWYDSEEVAVTFYPEDNKADVVDYTVYVDGEEKANGTAIVDQNKTVNLGIQAEGDRVIRVEVRDEAGKTGSAEVTIHVDLTEPTVEIRSPENGTWYDSEEVVVMFYPEDNKADVVDYTVYVDGEEKANGTAEVDQNKTVNLGIQAEGDRVIRVEVRDKAGKTGSAEVTIHVAIPPIVLNPSTDPLKIPDDTDNESLWGENATLTVTVIDESGNVSVTINLSVIGGSAVQPMTNIGGDIWSTTTNASAGTAGWNGTTYVPHLLRVNATDVNGKSNTSQSLELTVVKNGDVNEDGTVNFGDTTYLANHLVGTSGYESLEDTIADVNGDSFINFGDVTYLANYLVGTSGYEKLK